MKCEKCKEIIKKDVKEEFKIFEASKLRDALKNCLAEGYFPADWEQLYKLSDENKISKDKSYDTCLLFKNGVLRKATLEELENIDDTFSKGWRLWTVYGLGNRSGAGGIISLGSYDSRLVGVASETQSKKTKKVGGSK